MEFIGTNGWAVPRLKDDALSEDKLSESYLEVVIMMRTLYQKCKLVHGDLSKYNILYHEGHLYCIDVSQSVDLDHPRALEFLHEHYLHVSDFFKKNGVAVMAFRELFDFVLWMKILTITLKRCKRKSKVGVCSHLQRRKLLKLFLLSPSSREH